jgi:glucose/mannose transport system permease protein
MIAAEPAGRRPRHLTWGRIGVYAFLVTSALFFLLPLWIMLLTSVKTMDEIRLGNILAWPADPTLQPWIAAWSEACTGLACDGIQVGFWNSVRILIPSVILSILVGALNGYALCFWRVRGAELLFAILLIGAFIPYQVFLYPLVRLFSTVGIYNSLPGIVLVHIIFGMPIMTLLFRNFYSSLPHELFNAARIDGGGFMTIFWRVMLPMSTPMLIVATILQVTGIWNDFILA